MAEQAFKHNDRISVALIPALLVFCRLVEPFILAMLLVGLLVAYMLDASRQKELALASVWLTAALAAACNAFASWGQHAGLSLHVVAVIAATTLLALAACWATLQFRFVALQHAALARAAENVLIVAVGPVATTFLTWAILAEAPPSAAPFYALPLSILSAVLFLPPLPSAFAARAAVQARPLADSGGAPAGTVQSRAQCALLALLAVMQPAGAYAAINARHLTESAHLWSLALLVSAALLALQLTPRALWWLPPTLRWARFAVWTSAYVLGVAALEQRVVLAAFGSFVKLPAPWSWIIVTIGMYLGSALVIAYFGGLVPFLDPGLVGVACIAVCTAGGISIGLPTHILPFCLVAGAGLALFQESEGIGYYLAFVAGSAVCVSYFLYANFWFLDIAISGFQVKEVCMVIAFTMLPALLIPGVMRVDPGGPVGGLLLYQAQFLAIVEEHLYVGDSGESFYPAYLICVTSALGIAVCRRLTSWNANNKAATWYLYSMHICKLSVILLPESRPVQDIFPVVLFASLPLFFQKPDGKSRLSHDVLRPMYWVMLGLAIVGARLVVFDAVQAAMGGGAVEGHLLGALLATAAAAAAIPIYVWHPTSVALKRYLFLSVAAAAMLAVIKPPFPVRGGAKCPRLPFHLCPRLWDETHVPANTVDDINLYGEGTSWRQHWALWALMAGVVCAVLAALGRRGTRSVFAAVASLLVGVYLADEFVPGSIFLQILVVTATVLGAAFMLALHTPTLGDVNALAVLPGFWFATWGATLFGQAMSSLPELPPEAQRLFPDRSVAELNTERRAAGRAALLGVFAAQALLLALVLKLRLAAALRDGDALRGGGARAAGGGAGPRASYATAGARAAVPAALRGKPLLAGVLAPAAARTMDGRGSAAMARLAGHGLGWAPTLCNCMVFLTFGIALFLNFAVGEGQPEAIFALASLLLLLTQDPLLCPRLTMRHRYFPPFLAVVIYLVWQSITAIGEAAMTAGATAALVAALALLCPLPSMCCLGVFLCNRRKQSEWLLLFFTPLNVLPALFAAERPSQLLAAGAILGAAVQAVAMRRVRSAATRLI